MGGGPGRYVVIIETCDQGYFSFERARKGKPDTMVLYHLQQISGNFLGNFHRVKNVFHLPQASSPPRSLPHTTAGSLAAFPWVSRHDCIDSSLQGYILTCK